MSPLADTIRPKSLADFVGQEHLVGEGKPLRLAIEMSLLFSFVLWGPPGVGKTTLARLYAQGLGAEYNELSAVSAGKEDVRAIVARSNPTLQPRVLFLDEIHRFTKAQQDYLLPFVERGELTLIGATTENPSFRVNNALLSRMRVFTLKELTESELHQIIARTKLKIASKAADWLVSISSGDARQMLNLLEATSQLYPKITQKTLQEALQSQYLRYDRAGEEHYNTISAFIKSLRASDVDAALYYLARMIESGEDPLFIARRMVIFASEDIGMALPTALVVANAVFRACEVIGYPECAINLAQGVVHLASAPKDRRVYDSLRAAQQDVKKSGNLPIPLNLRNAPTDLMKSLDYGKGYEMYPKKGSLLPEALQGKTYFKPKK